MLTSQIDWQPERVGVINHKANGVTLLPSSRVCPVQYSRCDDGLPMFPARHVEVVAASVF